MYKSLFLALCVVTLAGCTGDAFDQSEARKKPAEQASSNEWKEFIAPLSVKTQTPHERLIKRNESQFRHQK